MAQLDRLLAVLAGNQTGVVRLDEGNPAQFLATGTGDARPITRTPLTGPQIVSLLREVAPPESAVHLERGVPAAFTYESSNGIFATEAEVTDGRWHVRIGTVAMPPLALVTDHAGASEFSELSDRDQLLIDPARLTTSFPARERIDQLLRLAVTRGASDLHLRCGEPPILRCHGEIVRVADWPSLRGDEVSAFVDAVIPSQNREELADTNDTDFAYEIAGCSRFRANAFRDRSGTAAVFRRIPPAVVTAEDLGLSTEIQRLCGLTRGLVLVTGPTGSGKSTTLCALLDLVNRTRTDHIVTIEDPIEFVHPSRRCVVTQRQVGMHTRSFKTALRAALREDPDVVLIGEMRDLETVSIALETAETGHLVFATLHTTTAATTIDRIIDQFPSDSQEQIRVMLADSLRAVISQSLCRKIGGGRVAAREILFNTPPIANLIRERKTFQIGSIVQTSKRLGMMTLNDSLLELVETRQIALDEAYMNATDKTNFLALIKSKGFDTAALEVDIATPRVSRASGPVRVVRDL